MPDLFYWCFLLLFGNIIRPYVVICQKPRSSLDKLKPTATGLDGLPVWFIRLAAPWIAGPISHIFHLSYNSSIVPVQWKHSCITPVPKTTQPATCADYRPISVTPVLSRVMERLIVRHDLYPVLVHPDFSNLFWDQFAFRPTWSTTAALIFLFHHLSHMLQDHKSVHLIALDFSRHLIQFDILLSQQKFPAFL